MEPAQWREVCRLFDDALALEASERAGFLAKLDPELRGEVAELLASYVQAGDFLESPAVAMSDPTAAEPAVALGRVGNYQLLELLGRGGMGAVYLAARADDVYRKEVAVKILQRGLESAEGVARFRAERQILAGLEHPNIARLLDGGNTDDGRPFLVMERVEGVPIDRFADQQKLTVMERLRLFLKVCLAVQFAHQNLIVHRDLKPGNVLITPEGEPKLLDFGIAKLLDPGAEALALTVDRAPLTPGYASPEQLAGERVTTASDVYSLGIVLFELLAGIRPIPHTLPFTARMEAGVDRLPPRPSSAASSADKLRAEELARNRSTDVAGLRRALSGDLDIITLKALQPDPQRRYGSARELAEDVQRFLEGLPILARPDSWRYRAAKFSRRHRWPLAAAATGLVTLVGFLTLLVVQRGQIQRQFQRASATVDFMVELFAQPDPNRALGTQITARELLDRGAHRIRDRFADLPALRADLLDPIILSYMNLGLYREALVLAEEALAARREAGEDPAEIATALDRIGELATLTEDSERGKTALEEALALRQQLFRADHPAVIESLIHLAKNHERHHPDLARDLYHQAISAARSADAQELLATALRQKAVHESALGHFDPAEQASREALEIYRTLHGVFHPEVTKAINDLALVLEKRGQLEAAEELLAPAERDARRLFGGSNPNLAITLLNRARVLASLNRLPEATPLGEEAVRMLIATHGEDHHKVAQGYALLGQLAHLKKQPAVAEKYYQQEVELLTRIDQSESRQAAIALSNLALAKIDLGQTAPGAALLQRALGIARKTLGDEHPEVAIILQNQFTLLQDLGDFNAAMPIAREALAIQQRALGAEHAEVARLEVIIANIALQAKLYQEVEALARHAHKVLLAAKGNESPWTTAAQQQLGASLLELGRYEEAEPILRAELEASRRSGGLRQERAERQIKKLFRLWQRPGPGTPVRD